MPARNKTGGGSRAASGSPRSDGDDSEAYKLKRKRNNDVSLSAQNYLRVC